jgi:hypothetical protein
MLKHRILQNAALVVAWKQNPAECACQCLKTEFLQNVVADHWKQNSTECTEKRILQECTLSVLEKEILSDGEETDSGSWNHKLHDLLAIEFANYLVVDSTSWGA